MKTTSLVVLFFFILFLGLIGLPFISLLIDTDFIKPSQKVGNFMSFETGPAIVFPGLNNSYLWVDPILESNDKGLDYIHAMDEIPNKTYDVIIIGDSFTNYEFGLSNGICRQGNFSTAVFYLNNLKIEGANKHLILLENLISSGFLRSTKPKSILIESAGRNNFLNSYAIMAYPKDRIVYDIPSLNLWLRYGSNISDIVEGLKYETKISLLKLPFHQLNIFSNTSINPIITYQGEPSLVEHPRIGENTSVIFSNIFIPHNTTLILKLGIVHGTQNQSLVNETRFTIHITHEDGTKELEFNQFIKPWEECRLVTIPMDTFSGGLVNLTFFLNAGEDYRVNNGGIYLINPTLISNSTPHANSAKNYIFGSIINFAKGRNSESYRSSGWSTQESGFIWTDGFESSLILSIDKIPNDVIFTLEGLAFTGPGLNNQTIWVSINNKRISKQIVMDDQNQKQSLPVPSGYLVNGTNTITLNLPNATSPKSLGLSDDNRKLGIAVGSISLTSPVEYVIGDTISFNEGGRSALFRTSGWSAQESAFIWTDGLESSLILSINKIPEQVVLTLEGFAFTGPGLNNQTIWVSINNKTISKPLVMDGQYQKLSLPFPSGYLVNGTNTLTLYHPNATSPKSLGISDDNRKLGIAIQSITFTNTVTELVNRDTKNKEIVSNLNQTYSKVHGSGVSYPIVLTLESNNPLNYSQDIYTKFMGVDNFETLFNLHKTQIISFIWNENQVKTIFRVRDTLINTVGNQFNFPIPATHKAKLKKRIHSSNVEYDTIYYAPQADEVRTNYKYQTLLTVNNNLNNLSVRLKEFNITLLFLIAPDTSHIYEEYYVNPPEPKVAQMYEDLRTIPKKYQYIDAEALIKQRVYSGELDLYPIFTHHWAPKTGSYVAEEIVKIMNNITN